TVRIDRAAPSAPAVSNDSATWFNQASITPVASGSTDSGGSLFDHYEYRVSHDGGGTYGSVITGSQVDVTTEADNRVQCRAVDGAGNFSGWTTATVRLD